MPTFHIEFDLRRRDWLLKAHPLTTQADLRFGNDSREGGVLGLIGAIDMVLYKSKRSCRTFEIHHWDEVSVVYFDAQDVPELATMSGRSEGAARYESWGQMNLSIPENTLRLD